MIFSTITCILDIVEMCGVGALNTPIFSSETLPPQNDYVTILATPQKRPGSAPGPVLAAGGRLTHPRASR